MKRLYCRAEIVASSVDGTVRRFDVRMGCMDVDQLGAPVTAMALSHDGNCVLASCLDGRMRLLDKASGELLAEYSGAAPLCATGEIVLDDYLSSLAGLT